MTDAYTQEKDSLEASANQVAYVQGVQLGTFAYTMKGSWVTNPDGSVSAPAFLTAFTPSANLSAAISQWLSRQPLTPPTVIASFSVTVVGDTVSINDNTANATDELFDYGDGNTEETMGDHTYTYSQSGTFTIRLIASNSGGSSTATESVTVTVPTTAPVQPPANSVAGQPATLTGTLADGTVLNLTANPGDLLPLVTGKPELGSFHYYADGLCVRIENFDNNCNSDLTGHFTVTVADETVFDDDLTIWTHAAHRPFWLTQPTLKPNPDLSFFPNIVGGATASMASAYAQADNGPMGRGLANLGIGNEGENAALGWVPQWDAVYLTNPSADNLAVMLGMADAPSVWPFHFRDHTTGDMLNVATYPNASAIKKFRGVNGNPIQPYSTECQLDLDQVQTHAVNYCALACALFGTDYHREELAYWCNYACSLWQNPSYRLACGVSNHVAPRGLGRGLIVALYAAKYAPDRWVSYFDTWVKAIAADFQSRFVEGQTGIQIAQSSGGYAGGKDFAPWQEKILAYALGLGIQCGYSAEFQPMLDYLAVPIFDSLLVTQPELSTNYTAALLRDDGSPVASWKEAITVEGTRDTKVAAALACATNTQALQDALGHTAPNNQPGDWSGYPMSPTGYPAMQQAALAKLLDHATDHTRALAAWQVFASHALTRIDYSNNPKYNVWPKTLA